MVSINPQNAWTYLLEDPCSLYVQSNINPERLQGDGWGIGFYTNGTAHVIKSKNPIYEEHEKFASSVHGLSSNIMLVHIRRGSNPRGLPREKLISVVNSQPFKYNNFLFAHNGTINIPDEVEEQLGEWKEMIEGVNDSELYFWFIVKEVAGGTEFREAVKIFEETLEELWQKASARHSNKNRPYAGLNAIFSDGERLYAYCRYHEKDSTAKSLCFSDQPAFQMSYCFTPETLIVSSEKTNRKDNWKPLKNRHLLTGEIKDGKVNITLENVT